MSTGRVHWPSALQFGLSALSVFFSWSGALVIVMAAVSSIMAEKAGQTAIGDPLRLFIMAAVYVAVGLLTLPSAYYSLCRILNLHAINFSGIFIRIKPSLSILAFLLVLLLGSLISRNSALSWLFFPLMHLLAVGLPVAWILSLATRSLPLGSPQRGWGVFSSGLLLAPAAAMLLEGLAGLVFLIFGMLYISRYSNVMHQITGLIEWYQRTNPTPEMLVGRIGSWLIHPAVIASVLILVAVVVPMIEEAMKPIGVWFLARKNLSPAAGFVAGAISGGAYAAIESLMLTTDSQQWVSVVVVRIGTAIVHIFTSGLVGWAIVQAHNSRGYTTLIVSYITSVVIHGMWNALTLFSTFSILASSNGLKLPYNYMVDLGRSAPFGLVFLAISMFITLMRANSLLANSRSRKAQISVKYP